VSWVPIGNLLAGSFELLLVNAHPIQAGPGRKTDVRDCEWIADLLRHGLLRGSYGPERAPRELRALARYRTSLVRERTAEAHRPGTLWVKTLAGANIKLAAVATDILGRSGRAMLQALRAGALDAPARAQLAQGRLREQIPELARALAGWFGPHPCCMVAQQLAHLDYWDAAIARASTEIVERLDTIAGIGRYVAEALLSELGTDRERFPTAAQLASWAGMGPGTDQRAGKRRSGRTRKGSPWWRARLVQAAHAAARKRDSYLSAQYRRLAARRGKRRAAIAVGHTILVIVYYLLRAGTVYHDRGPRYVEERDRQAVKRRLVHRLEDLGYKVVLEPIAA
jgi:transposase